MPDLQGFLGTLNLNPLQAPKVTALLIAIFYENITICTAYGTGVTIITEGKSKMVLNHVWTTINQRYRRPILVNRHENYKAKCVRVHNMHNCKRIDKFNFRRSLSFILDIFSSFIKQHSYP